MTTPSMRQLITVRNPGKTSIGVLLFARWLVAEDIPKSGMTCYNWLELLGQCYEIWPVDNTSIAEHKCYEPYSWKFCLHCRKIVATTNGVFFDHCCGYCFWDKLSPETNKHLAYKAEWLNRQFTRLPLPVKEKIIEALLWLQSMNPSLNK